MIKMDDVNKEFNEIKNLKKKKDIYDDYGKYLTKMN